MKESLQKLGCKETRSRFASFLASQADLLSARQRAAVQSHLGDCPGCAEEYRLFSLQRTVLDLTAAPEVITPDNDFFVALRARIERGPSPAAPVAANQEDSWANALWTTARQLIPAMAMLLLLIIGATLIWKGNTSTQDPSTDALYKVRGVTADDMLDTIVAEERINGR